MAADTADTTAGITAAIAGTHGTTATTGSSHQRPLPDSRVKPAAAATSTCDLCEFNPNVLATANAFLAEPLQCEGGRYTLPSAPGLGIEWNDRGVSLTR